MLRQRQDRVFLIWSLIWLIWTMSFIYVATFSFVWVATACGAASFVFLWYKFCDTLSDAQNSSQ